MLNKLKPCVCGSTLVDVEKFCGGPYRAYCFYCGKVGPECSTREEAIEVDYYCSSQARIIDKKDDYILVARENDDDSETIKKFNIKDKNIKFFSTREAANYAADIKNNIIKTETLLDVVKFKNRL